MVHRIANGPDFDQVIEVKADNSLLTTDTMKAVSFALNKTENTPTGIAANLSFLVNNKNLVLPSRFYLEFGDLE